MTTYRNRVKIRITGADAERAHMIHIHNAETNEELSDVEAFEIRAKVGEPITCLLTRFAHDPKGHLAINAFGDVVRYKAAAEVDSLELEAFEETTE